MISDLDSYVYVCPEYGQEFQSLQDYLEYSEGQHDYWISDRLGCSYFFPTIGDYQDWVKTELIAKGKTLYEWKIEQNLSMETNKINETIRIFLRLNTGGRQLLRLASRNLRKFSRKAKFARETALA
ncbi:MAG: hypothetical protein ACYTXE_43965 [Nostoc sp.]